MIPRLNLDDGRTDLLNDARPFMAKNAGKGHWKMLITTSQVCVADTHCHNTHENLIGPWLIKFDQFKREGSGLLPHDGSFYLHY
jgi:hypothetical protein